MCGQIQALRKTQLEVQEVSRRDFTGSEKTQLAKCQGTTSKAAERRHPKGKKCQGTNSVVPKPQSTTWALARAGDHLRPVAALSAARKKSAISTKESAIAPAMALSFCGFRVARASGGRTDSDAYCPGEISSITLFARLPRWSSGGVTIMLYWTDFRVCVSPIASKRITTRVESRAEGVATHV